MALVLETLPQIPYWPQMVRLGYLEEMAAQAARGLPGLKVDEANRTVAMDPDLPRDEALARFYEVVLSGDLTPFAFEAQDARGFFALLAAVASQGCPGSALKGQLSGPVTFAGVVKDAEGKPILYDRELTQAVCAGLARKVAWQAEKFRELGKAPIVFLDEPFLTGFGSAYLPISKEEVTEILTQTLEEARGPPPARSPWGFTAAATPTGPCCSMPPSTSSALIPTATLRASASMTGRWRTTWPGAAGWPGVWCPPTRTLSMRPRTPCGSVSRPR